MNLWPFYNYTPVIDWSEDAKRNSAARKHSERRQTKLDSSDPKVRAQAMGNLGQLSGSFDNPKLKKNSRLG